MQSKLLQNDSLQFNTGSYKQCAQSSGFDNQMQNLNKAKELSHKAHQHMNNEQYEQAILCYDGILSILRDALQEAKLPNTVDQLQEKVQRYKMLRVRADTKHKEREKLELIVHISKLGGGSFKNPYETNKQDIEEEIDIEKPQRIQEKIELAQGFGDYVVPTKVEEKTVKPEPPKTNQNQTKKPDPPKKVPPPAPNKKPEVPHFNKPVKKEEKKEQPNKKNTSAQGKRPQQQPAWGARRNSIDKKKGGKEPEKKPPKLDPDVEELLVKNIKVSFSDIVGLKDVKETLNEAVIRPRLRPDLYTGIRAPPRGLLLYGPPGNGKTYICKALAKESKCSFFAISASAIMSKWLGDSEKMIKKVFAAAQQVAPSVIFIDEIDSMLTARSEKEHQASRRLKTEFLVQMDGITSAKSGEILVMGATNLPKELDDAAKRRFSKLIYIGHPSPEGRKQLVQLNLKEIGHALTPPQMDKLAMKLEFFSASQIRNIVAQVSMLPLRELRTSAFQRITNEDLRKISLADFEQVLKHRRPILSKDDLKKYQEMA